MKSTAGTGARVFACASMLFLLLAGAAVAFAQGQNVVTLTGTVIDNVGAVPGVIATATNAATGLVRSAVTHEQGTFRLVALPPGRYSLKLDMNGFKQIHISDLVLMAGEVRDLGKLTLSAGDVIETITVTAEVTPVQTSSTALQKNLTSEQLTMLQVKGRDIFGMLKTLPGVVDTTVSRDYAQWRSGRGISINGADSNSKNTTIDGLPVGEEGGNGTTHVTPNLDAVSEVNVITSGYTAENGRQGSGVVAMVMKSGTMEFKGSGWYNYRRQSMNKNDHFRIKQRVAKPFFAVDMRGYSIGGPVIIPKVINSRTSEKKAFFFLSQEFTDDLKPESVLRTNLPTTLERNGDFSQTFTGSATLNPDGTISGTRNVLTLANPNPAQWPDFFIAPNVINPKYFNSMGRAMLNQLPLPNNQFNPAPGQYNNSNDAQNNTPVHVRRNTVLRMDTVFSPKIRVSFTMVRDSDDTTTFNRVAPGIGTANNIFPGRLLSGKVTWLLRPTVVNETSVGSSSNHYGFTERRGPLVISDYTKWYRQNVGLDPPMLLPQGPYGTPHLDDPQQDMYPYLPIMLFAGGSRANMANFSLGFLPVQNTNYHLVFQDDLSIVKGRHAFKFGFSTERISKTEPGGYNGQYNFGHSGDNPLSTGYGYANALIGNFTSYSELTARFDFETRHWTTDGYAQDTWRINPRMTLDYGFRLTHAGPIYEARGFNSAFDPAKWKATEAPALYRPYCLPGGVPGNVACPAANRVAINPLTGQTLSQAFVGTIVPGSGTLTNGIVVNGLSKFGRSGQYYSLPFLSLGPRVGFVWDVFGNGKTAIRMSGGTFYNFVHRSYYRWYGQPLRSRTLTVLNATINDIPKFAAAGGFADTPWSPGVVPDIALRLYGSQEGQGKFVPERYYQTNFSVQRDIGFDTVVEIAFVTNIGRHKESGGTMNNIPVFAYGNPANLFNGLPVNPNFIRRDWPGLGAVSYLRNSDLPNLDYHAWQMYIQRRMSHGLQLGLAYTRAKSMGLYTGSTWDFATEELYGLQGIKDRYYSPPSDSRMQDRRHVVVANWTYLIPTPKIPVAKYVLGQWEVAGVFTAVTGDAITPVCNSTLGGVANVDPSLSGVPVFCEYTGQPLLSGFTVDSSLPVEDQPHFNLAAVQRPLPNGAIGNFGNVKQGTLRNQGWSNWDLTLSRRLPIKIGRGGNVRVQLQFYNLFNQVEFNTLNAVQTFTTGNSTGNSNTNAGKWTATQNPFNAGITLRADF